jgi:hypothetical protein
MKEINLQDKTYLFVEVPDNAKNFELLNKGFNRSSALLNICWNNEEKCIPYIDENNPFKLYEETDFKIISTTKDITEEQRLSIIEEHPHSAEYWEFAMMPLYLIYGKKQYKQKSKMFDNGTENDGKSLQSLIQAQGLDINKNYLILKKL